MARPIWKGSISFGLIHIPVTVYSAERRSDLHFRMLDSRNMARVRYERVNEETGEEVPWNEIVKGYEYDEDNYVVLDEEELKKAAPEATQTVDLEGFVDAKAIDAIYFEKPYFLVPREKNAKGYVLLRETLRRSDRIGIAKVVIRTRQYLAAVLACGNALVLNLMRFEQELRDAEEYDLPTRDLKKYRITNKEVDMAEQLLDSMTVEWKPDAYHDDYRDTLVQWIEKKARAGKKATAPEPEEPEPEQKGAEIIDMMELLKNSMKKEGASKKSSGRRKTKSHGKTKTKRKSTPGRRKARSG